MASKSGRYGIYDKGLNRRNIQYSLGSDVARIEKMAGNLAAMAVEDTIRTAEMSVGYNKQCEKRASITISDVDDHCFRVVPLKQILESQVAHYARQIDPQIDGDPVDYRFSRFMLEAVRFFEKEERAGRNPS